jgi:hypothetical protein
MQFKIWTLFTSSLNHALAISFFSEINIVNLIVPYFEKNLKDDLKEFA